MDEQDDLPTSWRDDLRVEFIHKLLSEIVSAVEVAEIELPHIVICRDDETGFATYFGPFVNGLSALVFAERECAVDRELNDGTPLIFRVAALHSGDRRNAS